MTLLNTPKKILYSQGNAQTISLNGLTDNNGVVLNSDSITGNLIDCNGISVPGCESIILVSTGSLGNYIGQFGDNNFYPPVGTGYTLLIDGSNAGSGYIHFEIMVEIVSRSQ